MAMSTKAINLASFSSVFPSSLDKLNKPSKGVQNSFWVPRIPLVKAVQSPAESDTGRWAKQRRPQNADGDFFVVGCSCSADHWLRIINYDVGQDLRNYSTFKAFYFLLLQQVFTRAGGMSAVYKQPTCKQDRLKALQALLSCPTNSIRTEVPPPDILEAQKTFPIPIDEKKLPVTPYCTFILEYRLTDCIANMIIFSGCLSLPKFTERLARKIEELGGVCYMFLTHKDDVADHGKWSKRFSCNRILHSGDVEACTADVETKLDGNGPWRLGQDIMLIHTPGHTEGSVCLFYMPLKILFTGDHLLMRESGLDIVAMYNRYSVGTQLDSVKKLLNLDFNWIIPGHGRRIEFKDVGEKNAVLEAFVEEKYAHYSSVKNK
ncbi:hypothetical protein ES288_D13G022200v1 [Gossypium darwinii]|uniref:Metallo-beta-lactamase domain-containing protein n=1 Tax=Gossypium darwinii TaxID=34276 RepID=A0A5D1ZTQ3_GOSDA|nr:hypothetical protein ES288_D13G022200v1 [Gossypium darwinii]